MSMRILKEFKRLQTEPPVGLKSLKLHNNDKYKWRIFLEGQPETPYEGGIFRIDMDIPTEFPLKAPSVKFFTKIYHPSVNEEGNVCIHMLSSEGWKPSHKMTAVIETLLSLLAYPSHEAAVQPAIAQQIRNNRDLFLKTAKEWTEKYASNDIE